MHVWVDAPLTTRVTLNMMDFDGREVGRSAKSFEVPHVSSTHRLRAKGSRDASLHVESTRACWRFCGIVCVGAPLRARVTHEITHLDGRAVRVRPRELLALSSRCCRCEHLLRAKESHDAFGRVGSTHVERFCGCGRRRATTGRYTARDGAFGWASGVARPRVARAI